MSLLTARGGRGLVAVLLLLATVVFVIGVSIEKAEEGEHSEPAAAVHAPESGEAGADESANQQPVAEAAGADEGHKSETLFGIETESTPLVILGVALSLVAAGAAWWLGDRRWVLALVALFCLGFAVLDGIEAGRKWGEEATIAALALLALLLHFAAGVRAAVLANSGGRTGAGADRETAVGQP